MTVDREQIRRDVETYTVVEPLFAPRAPVEELARHCLALLAELEQAEEALDLCASDLVTALEERAALAEQMASATITCNVAVTQAMQAEARLAKVPALVEALGTLAWCGAEELVSAEQMQELAREALAAWESE